MRTASAHIDKKIKPYFKHNDRTNLNHKNINKELVHLNECDHTANEVQEKIKELYAQSKKDFYDYCAKKNGIAKRTKQPKGFHNFTKKENATKEFIIECNEHTTMEQLKELSNQIAELTKFTPLQIALHKDEGHKKGDKFITHYHAHISFYTLEKDTGLQLARAEATLSNENLSKIQTLTAECLNMQRGARNYEKGQEQEKYIRDYREYKAIQEAKKEAMEKIEFEKKLLKETNSILNAREADLKQKVKENEETYSKKFNELLKGKEKVLNDIDENYENQKSIVKNILTFGKHNKRIEADKYTAQMGFLSAFDKEKKKLEKEHKEQIEKLEAEKELLEKQAEHLRKQNRELEINNKNIISKNKELNEKMRDYEQYQEALINELPKERLSELGFIELSIKKVNRETQKELEKLKPQRREQTQTKQTYLTR